MMSMMTVEQITEMKLPQDPVPSLEKALAHKQEYVRQRAQIILLTLEGQGEDAIAEAVGVSTRTVLKWQHAWATDGLWIFPQEVFADAGATDGSATDARDEDADLAEDDDDDDDDLILMESDGEDLLDLTSYKAAPGIGPSDTMADAGRKLMLHNLAQMDHHLPIALLGEDIEGVHKMRVATRRLRSVLDMFVRYIDTDAYRTVQKRLRQTARRLGAVRDLDVFRGYVAAYVENELGGDPEPLLPMMAVLDARYNRARKRLEKWLNSDKYQSFFKHFSAMLTSGDTQLSDDLHVYEVNQMVPRLIYADLEFVRLHKPFLSHADADQLHAIRLDFKRLRYALESFSEVLGPELSVVIKSIKGLQDHMGEMNDMYVAVEILKELGGELAKPDREPVKAFRNYCAARADALQATLPQVWDTFDNQQIRQALGQAVGAL